MLSHAIPYWIVVLDYGMDLWENFSDVFFSIWDLDEVCNSIW